MLASPSGPSPHPTEDPRAEKRCWRTQPQLLSPPGCGLPLPRGEVGSPAAHVSGETQRESTHAKGTEGQVCGGGGSGGGGSGALLGAGVAAFDQQKLEFSMGALPKTSSQRLRLRLARPRAGKDTRRLTARPVQVASGLRLPGSPLVRQGLPAGCQQSVLPGSLPWT